MKRNGIKTLVILLVIAVLFGSAALFLNKKNNAGNSSVNSNAQAVEDSQTGTESEKDPDSSISETNNTETSNQNNLTNVPDEPMQVQDSAVIEIGGGSENNNQNSNTVSNENQTSNSEDSSEPEQQNPEKDPTEGETGPYEIGEGETDLGDGYVTGGF